MKIRKIKDKWRIRRYTLSYKVRHGLTGKSMVVVEKRSCMGIPRFNIPTFEEIAEKYGKELNYDVYQMNATMKD